jgi:hypothetical protein
MSTSLAAKAGQLITYAQATVQQREQALAYLKQRLQLHFPVLATQTWRDALTLFQPELLVMGDQVQFTYQDLTELAQYLSDSPELPLLDPPLYGPPTLYLAQEYLHAAELAVWTLPELELLEPTGSQRLYTLVSLLAHGNRVAEQVVRARRWGLAVGRPLPLGVPGGGASPGSQEVEHRLLRLRQVGSNSHS